MGTVIDPFGHKWTLGTHVRDVSPEEMKKAMEEWAWQNARLTWRPSPSRAAHSIRRPRFCRGVRRKRGLS